MTRKVYRWLLRTVELESTQQSRRAVDDKIRKVQQKAGSSSFSAVDRITFIHSHGSWSAKIGKNDVTSRRSWCGFLSQKWRIKCSSMHGNSTAVWSKLISLIPATLYDRVSYSLHREWSCRALTTLRSFSPLHRISHPRSELNRKPVSRERKEKWKKRFSDLGNFF